MCLDFTYVLTVDTHYTRLKFIFLCCFNFADDFRSLDYRENTERKPSHLEMATVQASAGIVAGACSSVVTTPIDTVKTRLQVIKNIALAPSLTCMHQ